MTNSLLDQGQDFLKKLQGDAALQAKFANDPFDTLAGAGLSIPNANGAAKQQLKGFFDQNPPISSEADLSSNWFSCKACQVGFGAVAVALFGILQLIPGVDVVVDSGEAGVELVEVIDTAATEAGETPAQYINGLSGIGSVLEALGIDPDKLLTALSTLGEFSVGGVLTMLCGPGLIDAC